MVTQSAIFVSMYINVLIFFIKTKLIASLQVKSYNSKCITFSFHGVKLYEFKLKPGTHCRPVFHSSNRSLKLSVLVVPPGRMIHNLMRSFGPSRETVTLCYCHLSALLR